MNDAEIIQCIESRDKELFDNVKGLIDGYVTTTTTLITVENQNIRHSIDKLTERVIRQNGSVRELKEWQAEMKGIDKGELKFIKTKAEKRADLQKTLQFIATIILALGFVATAYFGFTGMRQSKLNNKEIKGLGEPVLTVPRSVVLPLPSDVQIKYFRKDSLYNFKDTVR